MRRARSIYLRQGAIAFCALVLTSGPRVALAQSEIDQALARFFPGPGPGVTDQPPAWRPRMPGTPTWDWLPPECSLNSGVGTCPGYVTAVVDEQYFVVDSSLVRHMLVLQPKLQTAQERALEALQEGRVPSPAENTALRALVQDQDSLKRQARFVTLSIKANAAPHVAPLGDSLVSTLEGYPLFRRPWPENGGATLSVYVAPAGFVLGPSVDGQSHAEVRCVLVTVDAAARDEALARALLASVRYAGFADLIR